MYAVRKVCFVWWTHICFARWCRQQCYYVGKKSWSAMDSSSPCSDLIDGIERFAQRSYCQTCKSWRRYKYKILLYIFKCGSIFRMSWEGLTTKLCFLSALAMLRMLDWLHKDNKIFLKNVPSYFFSFKFIKLQHACVIFVVKTVRISGFWSY